MGNTNSTFWIIILLLAAIGLNIYSIYTNRHTESGYMQRDSLIQKKIDSISLNMDTYFGHLLWTNNEKIEEKENNIIKNKRIYKTSEEKLLHTPIDSVYLWTKLKLRERAGQ